MGFFDFFRSKKQKPTADLNDIAAKLYELFPGGPQQIEEQADQLHALLRGRLNRKKSRELLIGVKAVIAAHPAISEDEIVQFIASLTSGKISLQEARLVYDFLTGIYLPKEKTHFRQDISPPQKESPRGITLPHYQPGDTILSNYLVEDIITTGGMGVIYITTHKGWKVKVAIKSPTEEMLSDREFSARITKEADAWINLGLHPNIAYCYFVRAIEEVPHIFVEYVNGGNLKDWIESGRCADLKIALDLAIQFCHGMAYAHSKGMIHRDIKPANILMTKDGILKITDFGIARWGEEDTSSRNAAFTDTTKTIGFIGTPNYASPQQLKDAHNVHEETDIFSFGVCLWEMLLGRRPYPIALEKIPLPDPLSLDPDLPPELATLLSTLVAYDEEERKTLGGFSVLADRFKNLYSDLFHEPAPHCILETLDLKADGLNNRGVSYLELGQEEEASLCWEQALKEDPQHLEATFNYGYYRWLNGALFHEVLRAPMSNLEGIHEGRPEFWRLLAWLYYEQGDIDALEELQNSAHRVTDPEFLNLCDDLNGPTGRSVRVVRGHEDGVSSVSFSPGGNFILSGSYDQTIRLWDAVSGNELRRFEGHGDAVSSVAFSPDGRYIISGGWDNTLRLWDIPDGTEIRRFEGHGSNVRSVAFSPDGKFILSGGYDRTIRLWETSTGREIRRFEGHSEAVNSVAFSPDSKYLISGSGFTIGSSGSDNTLRIWEVTTGRELRRYEGHNDSVTSVAFSHDGRHILSGSKDDTITLWEVTSTKEIRRFNGHNGPVQSVAFSPNDNHILSGSSDRTIRIWDVTTGRKLDCFEGHSEGVNSVSFSPDGKFILSGSDDETIRLCTWGDSEKTQATNHYPVLSRFRSPSDLLAEAREIRTLLATVTACIEKGSLKEAYTFLRQIQGVQNYERNKEVLDLIMLCGVKGQLRRRDIRAFWHVATFIGHSASVTSVAFSPDGNYVLSGSKDESIRLWEVATCRELRRFEGHNGSVKSVAFSPDGHYVLSGSYEHINSFRCLDITTGREIRRFEGHSHQITSVGFSPDGRYALSGSGDNTIRLWEVATGKEIRRFDGHRNEVEFDTYIFILAFHQYLSIAFSPDGRYALAGSLDNAIRLWDVASGKELRHFEGHGGGVNSVAFSSDGRFILSGSNDKTVRLWEVATGKELRHFEGHSGGVNSVAFSSDGRFILSGSDDKTVRLWEVATGKELKCIKWHRDTINSVAFSPDSRYILSGSYDRSLSLWELDWEWEFPDAHIHIYWEDRE